MKPIIMAIALCAALFVVTHDAAAQFGDGSGLSLVAADTVTVAGVPGELQPGVPLRATLAECGDVRRPMDSLTGTFLEMEEEALQLEVVVGDRHERRQISFNDLIRLETGTERSLTKRGTMIGAISGALLGIAGTAIGANDTSGDAAYATGAGIGGLVGAGLGALLGSRSTTMEWREVPLYGAAYCQ